MSSMQINDVLAQIRALSAQTGALSRPGAAAAGAAPVGGFGSLLKQGIDAPQSGNKLIDKQKEDDRRTLEQLFRIPMPH